MRHPSEIPLKLESHETSSSRTLVSQRPVTGSFDGFFDLRLNQQLSTQWRRRWFETPSRSLWRYRNVVLPPIFITHTCTALLQQNTDIKQKHCYMLYWHAKTVTNYPMKLYCCILMVHLNLCHKRHQYGILLLGNVFRYLTAIIYKRMFLHVDGWNIAKKGFVIGR